MIYLFFLFPPQLLLNNKLVRCKSKKSKNYTILHTDFLIIKKNVKQIFLQKQNDRTSPSYKTKNQNKLKETLQQFEIKMYSKPYHKILKMIKFHVTYKYFLYKKVNCLTNFQNQIFHIKKLTPDSIKIHLQNYFKYI